MGPIGIGRIITRIVIILLSGWLTSLLSKILATEEKSIADRINRYSRTNLELTIRERKLLRIIRISLPIIIYSFVIAIFVIGLIAIMDVSSDEWADSAILSFVTIIGVLFFSMMNNIKEGNVSTLVAKELLSQNINYTLYLRAFKSDSNASVFSEKFFVRLLAKMGDPRLYAVGLPNEMDAPIGAKRVYISDSTWKQEVEELMLNATKIYLRVGNTEPCRWELGKSLLHRGKLILIVDNISEYDAVRDEFPDLPQLQNIDGCFFLIRYKEADNDWEIQKYKLSPKGYVDVTDNYAEYEKILKELDHEKKRLQLQKINPKATIVSIFIAFLLIIGLMWYTRSANRHYSRCYSMKLSYDIKITSTSTLGKRRVKEVFEADNDTEALMYAEKKFSSILDSLHSQYNGNLTHDDSLDLYMPQGYRVYNPKGDIIIPKTKTKYETIQEYTELSKKDSIHGAKWQMSIDDVQHISYFSNWQREDIVINYRDTTETIPLLHGRDTLADHIFDEYLFFLNSYSCKGLGGTILLSRQDDCSHIDIMQVYADVKFHLRQKYGTYDGYWNCKIKNITCDTIAYNDYSGVVVKTEHGLHGPRFDDMARVIIEQLY